jgi:diguanylate cyclase (GGDEF)-like protein/PAS domain S-box-containing protein
MRAHRLLRDAEVSARTRAERVRLLFSPCGGISLASLAFVALVLARLWPSANAFLLAAWAAAMVALAFGLAWLVQRYRREAPPPALAGRWERRLGLVSVLHGGTWGALTIVTLPPQPPAEHFFVMLLLGTASLGAAGALTPSRLAFYAYLVPAAALVAASATLAGPAAFALGGWMTVAFLGALAGLHELFHRQFVLALGKRFESATLAREQQMIFDTAAEAIALVRDDRIVKCNRRFGQLAGAPLDALIGQPASAWFPSVEAWERTAREAGPVIRSGAIYRTVIERVGANGERLSWEISACAVNPVRPGLGSVWMGRDITDQLCAEAALRQSEQRFRDLLSLSSDWYWEQDKEFRFVRASGGMEHLGLPADRVIGRRRWEIEYFRGLTPEQWRAHRDTLERHEPFRDFVYQVQPPEGEPRWFSISGKPVFDDRGEFVGYHGVGTDITVSVRGAERYRHLANHDMLTGLPNRRLLADRVELALALARRTGTRVALMLLDLDDFKVVNDTQGHSVGDQVLVTVAQRLRNAVRESDTVARLGGDEFVILLQDAGEPRDIERVGAKIIDGVREPIQFGSGRYRLGASIGVAVFPEHGEDGERLLQCADIAMYEAKREGGSGLQFSRIELASGQGQLPLLEEGTTRH